MAHESDALLRRSRAPPPPPPLTPAANTSASASARDGAASSNVASSSAVPAVPVRPPVWRRPSRLQLLALAPLALVLYFSGLRWLRQTPLWRWQQDLLAVDDPRWFRTRIDEKGVAVIDGGDADAKTPQPPPDALVVLGYCVDHSTRIPTAPLIARLELAILESCEHQVPVVVFSGGSDTARVELGVASEAEIMAEWFERRWAELQASPPPPLPPTADPAARALRDRTHALCRGLPLPRFILETTSTSTFENAYHSLSILLRQEPSVRRLRIVTNRFHQARSLGIFLKMEARRLEREERERRRMMWTPRPGLHSQPQDKQLGGVDLTMLEEGSQQQQQPPPPRNFEFSIATMPLEQSSQIPQLDFWREVLATMLYTVRRWI